MDRRKLEARRRFYNLCNPDEPLTPRDARYVDVDALSVRGGRWAEALASRVLLSEHPTCEIVTAVPGAGMTTELLRLEATLESAGWLPVHVEASEAIDLVSPTDTVDLLLAMVARTERVLADAGGNPPALERFWKWISSADVTLKMAGVEVSQDASLAAELRNNPSAREKVRSLVNANMTRFTAQIRDELTLLNDRARRINRAGLVIVFDGLEKLRGLSSNSDEVMASAARVLTHSVRGLSLPVHVIYTAPPALLLQSLGITIHVLPMIATADRSGAPQLAGIDAAREIIRRRVADEMLNELFGPGPREQQVEALIAWSGGSPKEIVRLLRECITSSTNGPVALERILALSGEEYTRSIPGSAHPWLDRVHASKRLDIDDEKEREIASMMLSAGVVLPYQNDKTWFDIRPPVRQALPSSRMW